MKSSKKNCSKYLKTWQQAILCSEIKKFLLQQLAGILVLHNSGNPLWKEGGDKHAIVMVKLNAYNAIKIMWYDLVHSLQVHIFSSVCHFSTISLWRTQYLFGCHCCIHINEGGEIEFCSKHCTLRDSVLLNISRRYCIKKWKLFDISHENI